MIAVFSTLIVFAISLVIIRVATVGLTMTGISKDLAQFQALSAFTGSGFTTKESEDIVNHPLRRRIVMHLMLMGHVGVVVAIPSVMLSFLNTDGGGNWRSQALLRAGVLAGGLAVLLLAASSMYMITHGCCEWHRTTLCPNCRYKAMTGWPDIHWNNCVWPVRVCWSWESKNVTAVTRVRLVDTRCWKPATA
jgi:hypothetical protein